MGTTLVCFAVREEATAFRKVAAHRAGVSILVTGMGRKNAENRVRTFLATHPMDLVLTCGFAGGLNPELIPGVVLFETAQARLAEKLRVAGARPAKIFCADTVAVTAAEKQRLRTETGADLVEMESEAIQAVCREKKIPCGTIRVISDAANEDLPLDFNKLYRPDMSLDMGKLAWAVAKSPGKIGALMRLQKRCQSAAQQLAEVLVQII